jgi:hypothetical protein
MNMPLLRLAALASLGLSGCPTPGDATLDPPLGQAVSLEADPDWRKAQDTWREAAAIAGAGDYPFDEAGQRRLFDALEESRALVRGLAARGLLTESEVGLLQEDIDELVGVVGSKRPTELRMATCYEPMPYTPVRDTLARLEGRLPLLERLATEETLHPDVVRRVLARVEADLEHLESEEWLASHPDHSVPDLEPVRARAREARAAIERIEARLAVPGATPLDAPATIPEVEP